jgi:hypothetical protein
MGFRLSDAGSSAIIGDICAEALRLAASDWFS